MWAGIVVLLLQGAALAWIKLAHIGDAWPEARAERNETKKKRGACGKKNNEKRERGARSGSRRARSPGGFEKGDLPWGWARASVAGASGCGGRFA